MKEYEYMKLPLPQIPPEIVNLYKLQSIASNGWVYLEIQKGMYGLNQAGILAYQQLVTHLQTFGFTPTQHTPGLWTHHTRPISFTLVVDNFDIKYTHKRDADFLIAAFR